jgi:hypothetical protein
MHASGHTKSLQYTAIARKKEPKPHDVHPAPRRVLKATGSPAAASVIALTGFCTSFNLLLLTVLKLSVLLATRLSSALPEPMAVDDSSDECTAGGARARARVESAAACASPEPARTETRARATRRTGPPPCSAVARRRAAMRGRSRGRTAHVFCPYPAARVEIQFGSRPAWSTERLCLWPPLYRRSTTVRSRRTLARLCDPQASTGEFAQLCVCSSHGLLSEPKRARPDLLRRGRAREGPFSSYFWTRLTRPTGCRASQSTPEGELRRDASSYICSQRPCIRSCNHRGLRCRAGAHQSTTPYDCLFGGGAAIRALRPRGPRSLSPKGVAQARAVESSSENADASMSSPGEHEER